MHTEQIFSDKQSARKFFLERRSTLDAEQITLYSTRLSELLCSREEFKNADLVLFYYPTRREPELFLAMEKALKLKKSIAFPISLTDSLTLDFRTVSSLDELESGAYGIKEPRKDSPEAILSERTLCVVPALAFDKQGFRLGYGKGYYDRFLKNFKGTSIGLCFDGFLTELLPTDPNDIAVDIIITHTGAFERK
jgi:5-formyltetrahydrofolate cyclo-ligase